MSERNITLYRYNILAMPAFKYKYPDLPSTPQPLLTKKIIENKPPENHGIDFRCVKCQKVVVEADDIYFITNEAKGNVHGLVISVWAVYREGMNVRMGKPYINPAKGLVYTLHCHKCRTKVGFLMRLSTQGKERNVQLAKFFYRKNNSKRNELLYPSLPGQPSSVATEDEIRHAVPKCKCKMAKESNNEFGQAKSEATKEQDSGIKTNCECEKEIKTGTEDYREEKRIDEAWAKVPPDEKSDKNLDTFLGVNRYLSNIAKYIKCPEKFMSYMKQIVDVLKDMEYFGLTTTMQSFVNTSIIRQCRLWLKNSKPSTEFAQEIFEFLMDNVIDLTKIDSVALSELIQGFYHQEEIQGRIKEIYEDVADPYLMLVWARTILDESDRSK